MCSENDSNKVHDQKMELLRAVFRNMYLKEKCDYLDSECKMLAQHIVSSQITKAESSETKSTLEQEFDDLRRSHDTKMQKLILAQEQIVQMSNLLESSKSYELTSLHESKSMKEELEIKNDMIKCLQEELISVRLDAAEKWAQIRELKQVKDELEKDKNMLIKTKPDTIARLQEELISAKLLETQYAIEFENVKNTLRKIKAELESHTEGSDTKDKPEEKVKISKKGVFWNFQEKNEDKEIILEEIKKLEEEKMQLQNRMPELYNKLEILQKHVQFKEAERSRLQAKSDEVRLNYHNVEKITLERKKQYDYFEKTASEKVIVIRNSCEEKNQHIDELYSKLDEISLRRQSCISTCSMREMNAVCALEEELLILQEKIRQLKDETAAPSSEVYHSESD